MYISTDYVFDGLEEAPFAENDAPNPVGYYGYTKYEGEKVVQSTLFRLVYCPYFMGSTLKIMLWLAETHNKLNVVSDQVGSPTNTFDLSRLLLAMILILTDKYGTYHASNEGFCIWADFVKEILRLQRKM
jgi:dTDP-4-dehydrorhamnose reductase